ncbi:hypothetical protein FACS1894109_05350 [Spirochaetia bacterium]|nr:hypothetical protein FACS1894109_05350 [Spirochaetia bacterium]
MILSDVISVKSSIVRCDYHENMDFAENLRSELDYQGLIVKELAVKSGINIHTLNNYLSGKRTMPPADAAVKIAAALGVTVEYLVTGVMGRSNAANNMSKYLPLREVMNDLLALSDDTLEPIKVMIKAAAIREKKKKDG